MLEQAARCPRSASASSNASSSASAAAPPHPRGRHASSGRPLPPHLAGPSESTHRLVGRSAAGFNLPQAAAQGGATGSGRAAAAVAAAAEEPGMRELRLALQAELLAMFGSTPQYHAACAEVGPGPLAAALAVLRQRDWDAVRDRDRAWELEENDPATVRIDDRIQITLVNGAEAVALAHLIASGEISGPRLHIIGG